MRVLDLSRDGPGLGPDRVESGSRRLSNLLILWMIRIVHTSGGGRWPPDIDDVPGLSYRRPRRPPFLRALLENLRHLIPYAELWGVNDDLIRDDMVRSAPREALEDLKRLVERHDDLLDEWLAGPEADVASPSTEYLAFTAMRMAADQT
jgi:hypothetical protein